MFKLMFLYSDTGMEQYFFDRKTFVINEEDVSRLVAEWRNSSLTAMRHDGLSNNHGVAN